MANSYRLRKRLPDTPATLKNKRCALPVCLSIIPVVINMFRLSDFLSADEAIGNVLNNNY
jgi:hypothetical protein